MSSCVNVLGSYSRKTRRARTAKWRVHIDEVAALRMLQHPFKISVYKLRVPEPSRALPKYLRLWEPAAPLSAIRDIELPPQIRPVNAVETKPVQINEPRRPRRRGHLCRIRRAQPFIFISVGKRNPASSSSTEVTLYFTSRYVAISSRFRSPKMDARRLQREE